MSIIPRKLCRVCITDVYENTNLFEMKILDSNKDKSVAVVDFLRQITNLEIEETDHLTNLLCNNCYEKVEAAFNLVQMCISSDTILRSAAKKEVFASKSRDISFESDNRQEELTDSQEENVIPQRTKLCKQKKFQNSNNHFKCHECSETFKKKIHLNVHLRSHIKDEEKQFVCKVCNKQFMYAYLLKQHEYKHKDQKPYPCRICDKGCLTAESLKRHMRTHDKDYVKKKHPCAICSKEFAYPSFLAEHMKIHTGEKPHLCSVCGKGFRQKGALHYHQRVHTGYKPFQCKICNSHFMSQSVLKVHMRKHTNERPYVCHICGMAFRQSTDLKSHQRIHTGDKPVLCTICGQRMSTTGQLTIHIRSHTGERPFVCLYCSKSFTTKTMLVKHERIHTGERPYVCGICGKAFNQSSTLHTHTNVHMPNKKRRRPEKPKEIPSTNNLLLAKGYENESCILYKNDVLNLGAEIMPQEYVGQDEQHIELKESDVSVKTQFTVMLPAPIPLLHDL